MDEDGYVFDHRTEGADEPGEVGEYVLFLLRVEDDLADVSPAIPFKMLTKKGLGLTPAPYVALPNRLNMKKSSDKPSQDFSLWFLMI